MATDEELQAAMTWPGEETILRVFGPRNPYWTTTESGPAVQTREARLAFGGLHRGRLAYIPSFVINSYYRRFIWQEPWPQPPYDDPTRRPVEMLHQYQGVTWCEAFSFERFLAAYCPFETRQCEFIAFTDSRANFTWVFEGEDVLHVGVIGSTGKFHGFLPDTNDVIIVWLGRQPLFNPRPPLSNPPLHLRHVAEHFTPDYALYLPHKEYDGWIWDVDAEALVNNPPLPTTRTAIVWEPEEAETEKADI